jgi:hypothetical protein
MNPMLPHRRRTGKMDFRCEIKASEVNVRNCRSGASNRTFHSRPGSIVRSAPICAIQGRRRFPWKRTYLSRPKEGWCLGPFPRPITVDPMSPHSKGAEKRSTVSGGQMSIVLVVYSLRLPAGLFDDLVSHLQKLVGYGQSKCSCSA